VNGFVDNITAFVDALGMDEPGIVISLANVPWQSDEDRNAFIDHLTREV
jgi:hypothetical protein